MITRRQLRAPLALGIAFAMTVAACGDDDDEGDADTPAATQAPATTEAPDGGDSSDTTEAPVSTEAPDTAVTTDTTDTTDTTVDGEEPASGITDEEWDAVVEAAVAEGQVTLYSVMLPNQNERLAAAFSEAHPEIDIEIVRTLTDQDARLETERDTGTPGADVSAHVNYPGMISYAEDGDLVDLNLPALADWDEQWLHDGQFFNVTFQVLGLGCNTELVDDCPESFEDLLDPRFQNEVGMNEPGSPVTMDFWVFLEEQIGEDGIERLRDQNPVFYATAVPLQQGLAAGEVGVAGYATAQLRDDAAAGAPVEFIIPEPAWSPPIMAYALGWAQNPNAALVLLNFMASPDGQTAIAVNGASALPGIEGTLADVEDIIPVDIYRASNEWFEPLSNEWRDFFGR